MSRGPVPTKAETIPTAMDNQLCQFENCPMTCRSPWTTAAPFPATGAKPRCTMPGKVCGYLAIAQYLNAAAIAFSVRNNC